MDAFGTWSREDFLKFLDAVESKYGIKQAMMYEWQYVPTSWLSTQVEVKHTGWRGILGKIIPCFRR